MYSMLIRVLDSRKLLDIVQPTGLLTKTNGDQTLENTNYTHGSKCFCYGGYSARS